MAKMRVHELAKELNIESKKIVDFLSTTEYAVKAATSGVEEAAQAMVRSKFAAPAPKAQVVSEPVTPVASNDEEIVAAIAAAIAMAESESDGIKFRVVSFKRR